MLMEDAMTNTDANSLYVLVCSLTATVISLPAVWYFTAAAYAPGVLAYPKLDMRTELEGVRHDPPLCDCK